MTKFHFLPAQTLVFSQFTRMLDILEDYLEMRGVVYARLDGSMGFADRQINIAKFKSHPACMVFLLSTRAAGLGLNLTEADTVILHDSDWVSGGGGGYIYNYRYALLSSSDPMKVDRLHCP